MKVGDRVIVVGELLKGKKGAIQYIRIERPLAWPVYVRMDGSRTLMPFTYAELSVLDDGPIDPEEAQNHTPRRSNKDIPEFEGELKQ